MLLKIEIVSLIDRNESASNGLGRRLLISALPDLVLRPYIHMRLLIISLYLIAESLSQNVNHSERTCFKYASVACFLAIAHFPSSRVTPRQALQTVNCIAEADLPVAEHPDLHVL